MADANARTSPGPSPALWRSAAIRRLFLTTMLGFSGLFLTLAALPAYAVQHGVRAGLAGLITTALLATTVVTQVFVGRLVRTFGFGRLLVGGLLALGGPSPLYLLSSSFGWLIAMSVVRGIGFGIIAVLCSLVAARVGPEDRLGEAIGIYGLAIAVPNLALTPLGVALTSTGAFGWVAGLAALPILAVALVPGLVRTMRPLTPRSTDPDQTTSSPGPSALRRSVAPSTILLTTTLAAGGLVTYLPIDRPSGALATVALLVFGTAGATSRWGAGLASDRFGLPRVLVSGVAVSAAGLLALGAALAWGSSGRADVALVTAAAVFGVGFGTVQNLTLILAFDRAGEAGAATASAVWNGAFDAGTSIGAFAVGALASTTVGFAWTLVACAALVAATGPISGRGRNGSRRNGSTRSASTRTARITGS